MKSADCDVRPEKVVCIFGVWDLLHVGHIEALERARLLGDRLVVGVPADSVVVEDKGSPPIIDCLSRARMLQAVRFVDEVVIYKTLSFLPVLEEVEPDILAVGSPWGHAERHIAAERWVVDRGGRVVPIPRLESVSTSWIKERVLTCHRQT